MEPRLMGLFEKEWEREELEGKKRQRDWPADRRTFHDGSWRVLTYDGSVGPKCPPPTAEERARWADEDKRLAEVRAALPEKLAASRKSFPSIVEPPPPGTRIYKVITQRDEFFGGKFNPVALTNLMNDLALDGWRVVAITTADISTFLGSFWAGRDAREEIIVFMEKVVE
jgi:hypothetical protein